MARGTGKLQSSGGRWSEKCPPRGLHLAKRVAYDENKE